MEAGSIVAVARRHLGVQQALDPENVHLATWVMNDPAVPA